MLLRHCGLDPQSTENKEILKQVQDDVELTFHSGHDTSVVSRMKQRYQSFPCHPERSRRIWDSSIPLRYTQNDNRQFILDTTLVGTRTVGARFRPRAFLLWQVEPVEIDETRLEVCLNSETRKILFLNFKRLTLNIFFIFVPKYFF